MISVEQFFSDRIRYLDERRFIFKEEDGSEIIYGGLSRSELKTAFVLEQNVEKLFRDYPLDRIGFLTITFPKRVVTPKEASKRFNSFNSHCLKDQVQEYLKVTEPHKDQRPHYHLLVVLKEDIRTGFNWDAQKAANKEYMENGKSKLHKELTRQYSVSAKPYLRDLWKEFRAAQRAYRLGRIELLPIRKNDEAAVKYVGKYIEKGCAHRTGAWKGVRLTSNSKSFNRAANCRFSWTESSRGWREYLSQIAQILGIEDLEGVEDYFGKKWAYKLLMCVSRGIEPKGAVGLIQFDKE